MARKLKWEAAAWSESTEAVQRLMVGTPFGGARGLVALVSAVTVEGAPRDAVWVERIVGQVFHYTEAPVGSEAIENNIKERVSVGHKFDPTTVPNTTEVSEPWSREESGVDNFLWERTQLVAPIRQNNLDSALFDINGGVPFWSVIDIRVGRLLRPTQYLAYQVQTDPAVTAPANGFVVSTWGWLRILMSEL